MNKICIGRIRPPSTAPAARVRPPAVVYLWRILFSGIYFPPLLRTDRRYIGPFLLFYRCLFKYLFFDSDSASPSGAEHPSGVPVHSLFILFFLVYIFLPFLLASPAINNVIVIGLLDFYCLRQMVIRSKHNFITSSIFSIFLCRFLRLNIISE